MVGELLVQVGRGAPELFEAFPEGGLEIRRRYSWHEWMIAESLRVTSRV
jgi:hypothetical protein